LGAVGLRETSEFLIRPAKGKPMSRAYSLQLPQSYGC